MFLAVTVEGAGVRVGAAIGLSVSGESSTADSLIREADAAMYAAKATGRWFAVRTAIVPDRSN